MINWNKMIEANEIFSDSDKRIALWCNEVGDTNDLALLADNVIENKIPLISVPLLFCPGAICCISPAFVLTSCPRLLWRYTAYNPPAGLG